MPTSGKKLTRGKIRVLLAEDHVIVREGTRRLLESEEGIEVVGEANDGEEAVQLAAELQPNVVIMDIAMPKLNGIEATRQIKAFHPTIAVLILSAYDNDQYILAILEAGAAGYLLKNVSGVELVNAIRSVYAGEAAIHPRIARKLLDHFGASAEEEKQSSGLLSDREVEILRMAARGMGNKDIASELFLSVRTVQSHLGNIFNKLGVGSRTEAIIYGLKQGWFTLEDLP